MWRVLAYKDHSNGLSQEEVVKQKHPNVRWQILQALIGLMVIAVMVSACSLSGNSSSNGTSNNSSSSSTPSTSSAVTPAPTHSVASTPPVSGTPTGKTVPANEVKPLVFNLVYNDAAMNRDVLQMYTPGSPTYHQFLSTQQIVQRYGPSDAQVQQVTSWLTQNGYTVLSTDPLHSAIKVQATVGNIERSLHITLTYHTFMGREFFTQSGDPKLPANINGLVQSIVGLDNFAFPVFQPPFSISRQTSMASADCSKYGANQTLTRDKMAAAYQINQLYQQGFQGQNMTIGVAEFDEPYSPTDVANYAACVGLPTPNIQNIDVDGHLAAGSGEGEAAMDLELIAGLAPKAQILDYQADLQNTNTSFAQGLVDVFNRVATDHRVQVLSVSYGSSESTFTSSEMQAVNNSLRTLAAEGISVLISSGDCGAFSLRMHNIATASFPASAPYAIAVGGTYLQVNNNNVRTSEVAWGGDDHAPVCQNEWGSGGGVSENSGFTRPSWQVGTGTTTQYNGMQAVPPVTINAGMSQPVTAPNGLRQVPDIAAAAYPNIAIYYKGSWVASGGTSAAAPIWAAGVLLVDQALAQHGKSPFGGVPEIYTLANHPDGHHPFNDITSGDNLFYTATPGWDYVTGWGSPNFNDILQIELAQ